ncbi:hypothetical protein [Lacunimicrobium album]
MIVKIDVSPVVANHAKAAGYRNIEEYVEHLVAQNISQQSLKSIRSQLSAGEWKEKFQDMLKHAEPGNPSVDDSRESIYGERIARINPPANSSRY